MTRTYVVPQLPPRPADGHKGTFRRLLVVGGSPEMLGATVFASTAALRSGLGLVQFALHRELLPHALTLLPEAVGHALDERSDKRLLADVERADAAVVGPGMGVTAVGRRRLLAVLRADLPTVVDADGLTLLAKERKLPKRKSPLVLTPHPGEMQRLGARFKQTEIAEGDEARIALATEAAKAYGATVILKGARTVVADGEQVFVNTISDSSLAKAGTGDVLAGVTGTMLAQLGRPFDAAVLAVHLHATAGVVAGERLGPRSTLARDVLDALPEAIRAHG